jgi:hypothetical protein
VDVVSLLLLQAKVMAAKPSRSRVWAVFMNFAGFGCIKIGI